MSEKTLIAWTDHTFNIAWGCQKVSPGCAHCYADTLSHRYGWDVWGPGKNRRTFGPKRWAEPLKWNAEACREGRSHRVFCSSMCDYLEDHPVIERERAKLWQLIRSTPHLDWQLLTKRSDRIADNLPSDWGSNGYANVWLGVSIENMEYANRADDLRSVPAAVRFISYEPALGPLDALPLEGLDWVIFGGESGPQYREADLQWSRDMRDKCAHEGVAYFHKQSSHFFTERGTTLDGKTVRQYPIPRQSASFALRGHSSSQPND